MPEWWKISPCAGNNKSSYWLLEKVLIISILLVLPTLKMNYIVIHLFTFHFSITPSDTQLCSQELLLSSAWGNHTGDLMGCVKPGWLPAWQASYHCTIALLPSIVIVRHKWKKRMELYIYVGMWKIMKFIEISLYINNQWNIKNIYRIEETNKKKLCSDFI